MAEVRTTDRDTGLNRAALQLLWTLPVAILLGVPLWFAARLNWCGYGGCYGSHAADQQVNGALGFGLAIVSALLVVSAVAIPAWLRPWWRSVLTRSALDVCRAR